MSSETVMPEIREIAVFCVGRAVMFACLAIVLVMLAFAFHPVWAFQAGAIMTLIMAGILVWKAQTAHRRRPEKTEVWLYIDENKRSSLQQAHALFASELRDVYARFAQISFTMACLLFVLGLIMSLIGVQPYQFAGQPG
jgi:hypothetical protein